MDKDDLAEFIAQTRDHLTGMENSLRYEVFSIEDKIAVALKAASLALVGLERLAKILEAHDTATVQSDLSSGQK